MKTGFGWIEFGGTRYEHDLVIHCSGEVEKRKKKVSKHLREGFGHTPLSEQECIFLEEEHPEVVYIGTGQHGALPLTPGAKKLLAGYTTVIAPTPDILVLMEREERSFAAILHVTC
ncbi:MAG: hypothetical protein MUC66_04375 [Methanolinea sp.]|jgi:hypothetical protein|nr:hypothetical protein [Methanolinea sp.]